MNLVPTQKITLLCNNRTYGPSLDQSSMDFGALSHAAHSARVGSRQPADLTLAAVRVAPCRGLTPLTPEKKSERTPSTHSSRVSGNKVRMPRKSWQTVQLLDSQQYVKKVRIPAKVGIQKKDSPVTRCATARRNYAACPRELALRQSSTGIRFQHGKAKLRMPAKIGTREVQSSPITRFVTARRNYACLRKNLADSPVSRYITGRRNCACPRDMVDSPILPLDTQ